VPKYLALFGRHVLVTAFQASLFAPAMLRAACAKSRIGMRVSGMGSELCDERKPGYLIVRALKPTTRVARVTRARTTQTREHMGANQGTYGGNPGTYGANQGNWNTGMGTSTPHTCCGRPHGMEPG
jgi:hypothetical protein